MANIDTKRKLIDTTKQLLLSGTAPGKLTARQISSDAGTNLAMINYCFKSKDELLKNAVEEIITEEFNKYSKAERQDQSPKQQLKELLLHICIIMIKYMDLTRVSIPYLLLNSDIELPYDILPFIKEHYGDRKNETECRVIAFQIVYMLQLVFYRAEDFNKYCAIDIRNERQLTNFLDIQLDLYLGGEC